MYQYGSGISSGAGPHAVTVAGGKTYQYDANGNMTSGGGRSIQWSSYNKPIEVTKGTNTVAFKYGPDRSRYLKTESNGNQTLYIGKLYEQITNSNQPQMITHKQFIYAGGQLVATHSSGLDSLGAVKAPQTRYLHKDNLGSIDTITDALGNVVDRMSFDPFGQRRQNDWRAATAGVSVIPVLTNRGFTGHEHLDDVGLIHMNGRVYDAELGRFLSADPHIQAPYSTQSFNRYSYVMNNPLKYTDPSGYIGISALNPLKHLKRVHDAAWDLAKGALRAISTVPVLNMVVQTVGCYFTGPGCPAFLAMYNGATTYAVTGELGAALKSAVISYATGQASAYVGGKFAPGTIKNILGNGVVQGLSSKAQGGSFKDGFVGAAFAAAFKPTVFKKLGTSTDLTSRLKRITTAAVIGGTASRLGGGKFANGAVSGAYSQMLNGERHIGLRDKYNPDGTMNLPKTTNQDLIDGLSDTSRVTGYAATGALAVGQLEVAIPLGSISLWSGTLSTGLDIGINGWGASEPGIAGTGVAHAMRALEQIVVPIAPPLFRPAARMALDQFDRASSELFYQAGKNE